jgi:hypothetical protein
MPVIQEKIVQESASGCGPVIKAQPSANKIAAVRDIEVVFQTIGGAVLRVIFHRPDHLMANQITDIVQVFHIIRRIQFEFQL